MRFRALTLAVLAGVLSGCHGADDVAGLRELRRMAHSEDCRMTDDGYMSAAQKCAIIRNGIDYLLAHANISCRDAGAVALSRFLATDGTRGFDERQSAAGYDMETDMQYAGSSTTSGWGSASGYTHVDPDYFRGDMTDPLQVGGLVAHEEKHQDGSDGPAHNTGIAQAYHDACRNSQA